MDTNSNILAQLNLLKNTKQDIKTAIEGKKIEVPDNTPFSDYAQKIKDIEIGVEGGIDTSDATATADDLVSGKTAYAKGQKITGNVETVQGTYFYLTGDEETDKINSNYGTLSFGYNYSGPEHKKNEDLLEVEYTVKKNQFIPYSTKSTNRLVMVVKDSIIADTIGLTADQILEGNKVLGIEGTGKGGIDTSDATATASDLVSGKTAYVNGEKIEGSLDDVIGNVYYKTGDESLDEINSSYGTIQFEQDSGDDSIYNVRYIAQSKQYLNYVEGNGNYFTMALKDSIIAETIGLTADKLLSGNTILGIEGTGEGGIDTSDANATSDNIEEDYSGYVNGEKIEGSLGRLATTFEFTSNNTTVSIEQKLDDTTDMFYIQPKFDITSRKIIPVGFNPIIAVPLDIVASGIELTADKIIEGNTILGIEGTAKKAPPTILNFPLDYESIADNSKLNCISFVATPDEGKEWVVNNNTSIRITIPYDKLAEALGLTEDILLTGNTILGVRGTAVTDGGQLSEQDYSDAIALCKDIKGIEPLTQEVA